MCIPHLLLLNLNYCYYDRCRALVRLTAIIIISLHLIDTTLKLPTGFQIKRGSLIIIDLKCHNDNQGYLTAILTESTSAEVFLTTSTPCTSFSKDAEYQSVRRFSPEDEDHMYNLKVLGEVRDLLLGFLFFL